MDFYSKTQAIPSIPPLLIPLSPHSLHSLFPPLLTSFPSKFIPLSFSLSLPPSYNEPINFITKVLKTENRKVEI